MRIVTIVILLLIALNTSSCTQNKQTNSEKHFDSSRAFQDVAFQLSLGPRTVGSEAHQKTIDYIANELKDSGWGVKIQNISDDSGIEIPSAKAST